GQRNSVDSVDAALGEIVDQVEGPRLGQRVLRMLEPEDQARPVLSADIVQAAITIDIETGALDDADAGTEESGTPFGGLEEADFAIVFDIAADDIHASRAGEVAGSGALIAETFRDDVTHPGLRRLIPEDSDAGSARENDIRQTIVIGVGDADVRG